MPTFRIRYLIACLLLILFATLSLTLLIQVRQPAIAADAYARLAAENRLVLRSGACIDVLWETHGTTAVYLNGRGLADIGERRETICVSPDTPPVLEAHLTDGTIRFYTLDLIYFDQIVLPAVAILSFILIGVLYLFSVHVDLEFLIVFYAFLIVNTMTFMDQRVLSLEGGRGWDGVEYHQIAGQFINGQTPEAKGPFVYRVGTPFLASLMDQQNLITGFGIANLIANIILTTLFYLWLRRRFDDWRIRVGIMLLFFTQWHAPLRILYYMPVGVDHWFLVVALAGLLVIDYFTPPTLLSPKTERISVPRQYLLITMLTLIVIFGVLIRETMLLIPLATLFARNPVTLQKKAPFIRIKLPPRIDFIPLMAGLVTYFFLTRWAIQNDDYAFMTAVSRWLEEKSIIEYVGGLFVAFGPILILPIYNWKGSLQYLKTYQAECVFLCAIAVAAYISGNTTHRIFYWSFPIVYVLVGKAMLETGILRARLFIVALLLTQALSQRVLWSTPDYPNSFASSMPILTSLGENVPYFDLTPNSGPDRTIGMIQGVQYICLAALFLFYLWYKARSTRNAEKTVY